MIGREISDDGNDFETTDRSAGHTCPNCGERVHNSQGLYTCLECEFTSAPTTDAAESSSDDSGFLG